MDSIEEKRKEIARLNALEMDVMVKITKVINRKKSKRKSTNTKRCFEIMALAIHLRHIITQKLIVASQPIKLKHLEGYVVKHTKN